MLVSRMLASTAVLVALLVPASARPLLMPIASDMRNLMPGSTPDVASGTIRQNIYEGLVAWKDDGSVAPMLAENIRIEDDGKTYVFTLRDGVTFHNGAPLTSAEVVWSWNQFLFSDTPWACRSSFTSDFLKIEAIEALDERTVAFSLAKPSGALLGAMARSDCDGTGIAHPASVNETGDWVAAVGTGPFKLAEWEKGKFIRLVKNADYASRDEPSDGLAGAKEPLLDEVRLDIIPDANAIVAALQTGALDLWPSVDAKFLPQLESAPGLKVEKIDTAGVLTLPLRADQAVTSDPKVRQAIAWSLDTDALRMALTAGTAAESRSLVPVTSQFYGEAEKTAQGYDPETAKTLLAESGYKGEEIVIVTNKGNAMMADTAIYAQAMMSQVGLNARVDVMEFPTQFERFYSGNYQMMTWNVTPYLDPIFIFERFIGDPETQKDKVWTTDGARALLGELFAAQGDEEKQRIITALHELFVEELPMIVWAGRAGITAYTDKLEGYHDWPGQKARFWNLSLAE